MTEIEKIMTQYKEKYPELWERTELIARIIHPDAWSKWNCAGEYHQKLSDARLKYMRSAARVKAQEILCAMGINTDVDWVYLLTEQAKREE